MAVLIERTDDMAWIETRATSIRSQFDLAFWKGDGYRSGEFTDDRANAVAVLAGLASRDKWPAIAALLGEVWNATPYMEGYVLEAMYRIGYPDQALMRMKARYAPLTDNENSTLWEHFSIHGTRNHAWSGGPLTILAKYVAGLYPATPGYETYFVMPQLSSLTSLSLVVPSIKGRIELDLRKEEDQLHLGLISPPGTEAIVGIPRVVFASGGEVSIACQGIMVWSNGELCLTPLSTSHSVIVEKNIRRFSSWACRTKLTVA